MKTTTTPTGTGRARLGLIVSMTVFGTIGLFVRRIEITSAELALCRAGLAAVFLLLSFLVTRRRLCLSEIKKSLWLLLASGAAMGINWMLLFEAYQYTTISLATLSYYLAPVIVTALCPLLFHEKMTRAQFVCFLMSTLGVALIIAMVVSSLVGTIIPMLFHKIHIDPAVASGPLITTINDLVAVVVYYGLAMIVLIDIFHLG